MIEQAIANKILEIQQRKQNVVIAFCGAADLGKSYLADKVVQVLNNRNIESSHLTLDSFLMDRAERKKKKISGYDSRAHDLQEILAVLQDWKSGRTITFRPYDHHTGTKSKDVQTIRPAQILLIEGLFSMHDSFQTLIDGSFFFYTSDEKLKEIKLEADLTKRNYTREYSRSLYAIEFRLYQQNIEPFKEKADFRLFLKEKWQYELEKK